MTREQPPSAGARGNMMPFVIIVMGVTAVFAMLAAGIDPWDTLFINPLTNALVLLDKIVFNQFGLAILLFTLIMRLATIPFTIRQLESMRAMQTIQPQVQDLQKKYKDPKRRQEEMMKLYREHNINPLGCFMPMLIQMVVFFALYRSLVFTVGGSPESLIALSQRLYPIGFLQSQIPLQQHFLWLNLGQPDSTFALPLIVGLSTYIQQKMSVTPNASAQMQQQQQMMTWMMPMMFVFLTLSLPSGVGVYWVASNIFSLVASYYVYGKRVLSWRQLLPSFEPPGPAAGVGKGKGAQKPSTGKPGQPIQDANEEAEPPVAPTAKVRTPHGKRRGKRKNRR